MELFVAILNGWKPLTFVIKGSIFNAAKILDLLLRRNYVIDGQVIDGLTHILPNSTSFTTETNFVTDSGVIPSLFPRWHHQLIFAKVTFTTPPRLWAMNLGSLKS